MKKLIVAAALAALAFAAPAKAEEPNAILNVSYDIARELYAEINKAFIAKYKAETGKDLEVKQSHAGSSKQARAILEGLEADVVTFNQVTDVQILSDKGGLVAADWQTRLPNNASPYYSFPSFLVREGNPKGIKDWGDLVREDVKVIFPNPKTSGNARYTYLAAWAYAKEAFQGDETKIHDFIKKLFANVPVFDTGGRGATTTFVERETGDVLITFEAETRAIAKEFGEDKFDLVTPPASLLAEFPVAVVDKVVDKRGSRAIAESYLKFLYSPEGQEIVAQFGNRVHEPNVVERHKADFPEVKLVTVEDVFGGWPKVTKEHFGSDGILDQLFVAR
ncbi:sulfate ABC transporter substrate-binding protein [Nordella sp. HKS 07]|uniref:thiosulfate ABC transporter substrate-binding protein CysP n=1 Tax=Nordella sp. HKS 07 TaxID=2712222 RepID=UPI0013E0EBC4|nr:thiosulfate ABC transporter substrate-binding protein CysP [Nordella sp. HKS 07]QIG46717.1 sulfate ABC transporter substrate-binding protein [Nordella sp. HKS 07]